MILKNLFDEMNKENIRYCVLRKYENLPEKPNGDVDILIETKDFHKTINIVNKLGFVKYPYVEPHYFYFYYEEQFIRLDLVVKNKITKIKKYKNFYVPINWGYRVKKNILHKILTNLSRKIYYLRRGKLIVFCGPDGCGKTTTIENVREKLKEFPIKKKYLRFARKTYSKVKRSLYLISLIITIEYYLFVGRIVICDRYIYLTFRNKPLLRKLLSMARKPHITYFLDNTPEEIRKRKKELTIKEIKAQIDLFKNLATNRKGFKVIKTNKTEDKISNEIAGDILGLYKWN